MKLWLLRGVLLQRDLANGTDLRFTHFDELKLRLKCELLYYTETIQRKELRYMAEGQLRQPRNGEH